MGVQRFTDELWASIEDIYKEILVHPFVGGLTDGSLNRDAFRFYVIQDAHYLREYARSLSLLAARAPHEDDLVMFCNHAAGAVEVERALHESFLPDFGMTRTDVDAALVAPTNLAYTSYLLRTCYSGSFAEGLGAVLPCYWIYWEVGKALIERGSPDPLYGRWIDTYGGEEFAAIVFDVVALTARIADGLGPADRSAVLHHFGVTSRYEWMFWDMAYRQEEWPV